MNRERSADRMDLLEIICTQLPPADAAQMCELASSDSSLFLAEVVTSHKAGRLVLPTQVLRTVLADLHHFQD